MSKSLPSEILISKMHHYQRLKSHSFGMGHAMLHTCLNDLAISDLVKFATALVLREAPNRSAYSRTFAMMNSENMTRSPGSPEVAMTLCSSIGMILSSSCLMVMICCAADVSLQTMTKSLPLMPIRYSMLGWFQLLASDSVLSHNAARVVTFALRKDKGQLIC